MSKKDVKPGVSDRSYKFIKLLKHSGDCPTMLAEDGEGKRYVQKLLDETQLEIYRKLACLDIPGIPKITIAGLDEMVLPDFMEPFRDELKNGSSALLVEEYIDGSDLEKLIESGYVFSKSEFSKMMLSLCRTLGEVHKAGIVHRDIKPANIIRSDGGDYCIIDFGIARIPEQSGAQTKIVATLGYAAPEQLEGKPASPESDIYALGRLMKEILPKGRAYRSIYKKATMDEPKSRYRSAGQLANAIRFVPVKRSLKLLAVFVILLFILILLVPESEGTVKYLNVYDKFMSAEQMEKEERRLLEEIADGNDGFANFMYLSELYEKQGDIDKAADILIEYTDTVFDRRLYSSDSPLYERLEKLKPSASVDKQAEILELDGNADYIDRLLAAGEYDHAKQILDEIKADPCRELVRSKYLQLDDYYYQLYEKTADHEKAAGAIFDIYEHYFEGKGKIGKGTIYHDRLYDLYGKVSEDTRRRIDEICE